MKLFMQHLQQRFHMSSAAAAAAAEAGMAQLKNEQSAEDLNTLQCKQWLAVDTPYDAVHRECFNYHIILELTA